MKELPCLKQLLGGMSRSEGHFRCPLLQGAEAEPLYYSGARDSAKPVIEWIAKETGR